MKVYEEIFDIKRVEVSDLPKGENEVIFSLYGVHFHMLDENPDFQLIAPTPDDPKTIWFNVTVPDIEATFTKAAELNCTPIQPITHLPSYGVSNALFLDPFGYIWMLHQVHRDVSHEERIRLWEKSKKEEKND